MAQTQTEFLTPAQAQPLGRFESNSRLPRVLRVETGINDAHGMTNEMFVTLLDYHAYDKVAPIWRAIEGKARFDLYLALRARQIARDYDIVWAGSEKVAIPLTLLGVRTPMVVTLHYPQARTRAALLKYLKLANRWQAIGYVTESDRDFYIRELGVPPTRLFRIYAINLDKFQPTTNSGLEYILCAGVAKRDYDTLLHVLTALTGYRTEIFASSRYGDKYAPPLPQTIPAWVHFHAPVSEQELMQHYQRARFVVVPLEQTAHSGAGVSAILEASAMGKAVIATQTRGTLAHIVNGETGILVPPYDVSALSAAIQKLWTDPELARRMGENGRRFVRANFDPDVVNAGITDALIRVYQNTRA